MSMTSVVNRYPLHNLSMNGAQANGTKRKSTRLAFDPDDDAPPAKKNKGEGASKSQTAQTTSNPRPANGKVVSSVKPKAKKSYDEDDGGFAFTRTTRSRNARSKTTSSDEAREPDSQQHAPSNTTSPEPAKPKKKPRKTLPTTPELERQEKFPARRSKRLSAENNQPTAGFLDPSNDVHTQNEQPTQPVKAKAHAVSTPRAAEEAPEPEASPLLQDGRDAQTLHVDKKRRVTKIPLPFADTPILRRNKEMRKLSAEQSRRSSSGMRGRRASSLIDAGSSSGMSNSLLISPARENVPAFGAVSDLNVKDEAYKTERTAVSSKEDEVDDGGRFENKLADGLDLFETAVPHSEVEAQDFYKHISQDLVEPKRMRQLLIWCGSRNLPEKAGGQMDDAETAAVHAARVIQEELLSEFGSRNEMSNWFDREETAPTVLVKKPNPRNIQNAGKLQQLEAELARLQLEKRSWDELTKSTSAPTANSNQANAIPSISLDPSDIDSSLLDPSQAGILRALLDPAHAEALPQSHRPPPSSAAAAAPPLDIVANAQERIASIAQTLEFRIDQFVDSTHRLEQYRQTAERVADRVLSTGAQKLEEKDQKLRERSGGKGDIMDTLRGLGRVLNDKDRR